MNGKLMYEIAQQHIAEQQRAAREAREARSLRAIARGRRAKASAGDETAVPAIPDFAADMFAGVSAPREEEAGGQPARPGR